MEDETSPLLPRDGQDDNYKDHGSVHRQFCTLVGLVPSDISSSSSSSKKAKLPRPGPNTLYERAVRKRRSTQLTYAFTSSLSNTLLLSQIVLGAALTGLGASASSPLLVTIFGALNTIIAGVIAYIKSRGQPMRSRMFRDDLERVVDEIENSEVMWLGIANHMHGYDDIDTDDDVSVRAEVARLTRLYDRAVRNNTLNNPDMYAASNHGSDPYASLRAHTSGAGFPALAATALPPVGAAAAAAAAEPPKDAPAEPAKDAAAEPPKPDATPDPAPSKSAPVPGDATSDDKPAAPPARFVKLAVGNSTPKADDKTTNGASDKPSGPNVSQDATSKTSSASAAAPAPAAPSPAPAPAPPEPPAGVPLAADVDEGPVTAPTKKKEKNKNKSDDDEKDKA